MKPPLQTLLLLTLILGLCLTGCAAKTDTGAPVGASSAESFSLDDYDDEEIHYSDPLEPWNRFWFAFNDFALLKIMKPLHGGYRKITPPSLRNGISNFSYNLGAPLRMANSLLQGKFGQAGVEAGRFFINTVTSLGFARVADRDEVLVADYTPETANFNGTLRAWGLPTGAYIIWPLLGPSSVRGTVGMVGDAFMTPQSYVLEAPVSFGTNAFFRFNDLEQTLSAYESMAIDPYAAIRSGYFSLIRRQSIPLDLYGSSMDMGLFQ